MSRETDKAVIDRLFHVLRCEYGSYWVIAIGDEPIGEIKAAWLKRLNRYSAEDIGKTLKDVKKIYPKRPPDLEQFVKLLKHLKGTRLGHLSDKLWQSDPMEKTTASGFRERIKAECGV